MANTKRPRPAFGGGTSGGSAQPRPGPHSGSLGGEAPRRNAPYIDNGYIRVRHCRHGWFMYNLNDRFVSRSLNLYGEWAEPELAFIAQFIKPGDVVLDVGAHIGTHAVFFAQAVGPQGRVFAFEPQRLSFHLLCGNAALNNLMNLKCLNVALGACSGTVEVPIVDPTHEFNFGSVSLRSGIAGEPVRLTTIDSLGLAKCDFIKVDVEGLETEVLQGARETVARFRPVVFLEANRPDESPKLIRQVLDLGYRAFWQISSHYNADNFFGNPEDVFEPYQPNSNIVCLPPGAPSNGLFPVAGPEDTWRTALERFFDQQKA